MANLAITVDEETLKRARIRALERGESVNQNLAARLEDYEGRDDECTRRQRAAEQFVSLSREIGGSSHGRGWTRDELYDERIGTDR